MIASESSRPFFCSFQHFSLSTYSPPPHTNTRTHTKKDVFGRDTRISIQYITGAVQNFRQEKQRQRFKTSVVLHFLRRRKRVLSVSCDEDGFGKNADGIIHHSF